MWSDGVSKIDMLAYEPYAELIFDVATSERLNPLTIGLFGNWGSGKSTLLNLVEKKVKEKGEEPKVITITVNAWMFEGYDDAKTALMDSIIRVINENESIKKECKEGIGNLIKKVDWIRVGGALAKRGLPLVVSAVTGNPMPAIMSSIESIKNIDLSKEDEVEKIGGNISKLKEFLKEEEPVESIVENIRTFRKEFEKLLEDSQIENLIIMIDDLDRCTPDRILETLEAIKLFLSVKNTTFIIAMDEDVITYSIKRKYPQLNQGDEIDVSKDYIEKIVQLPIKLPELSEIDIKNYILLLICEMFLKSEKLTELINKLREKEIFTKGEIISSADIHEVLKANQENEAEFFNNDLKYKDFEEQLAIFSKIGDIISCTTIKGNPRQAKRFLNTFYIRKKLSDIQSIKLDLSVLAKLMVLEYTDINLFKKLYRWQYENEGVAAQLTEIEELILNEKKDINNTEYKEWAKPEMKKWISVEPTDLSKKDLRQYFYLSRESVREKEISMLNIGLEERKIIKEICTDDIDSTVKRRKVQELTKLQPNKIKVVVDGIISKFHQDKLKYGELMLYIIEYLPDYKDKAISEMKTMREQEIDPSLIILTKSLEGKMQTEYEILKDTFTRYKRFEKMWDMA
ncbi:MAG: P-loop NTPase fold protein [Eubacteriales bacterium]|nr:P-loop NTPase fold protein [Eubacteriales bacterium]